jgi:hypothetical protein
VKAAIQVAVLLALVLATGCTSIAQRAEALNRATSGAAKARVEPPPGVLFSNYHAPSTLGATSFGTKAGKSATFLISLPPLPIQGLTRGWPLFAWGDASEHTAAVKGQITEVKHVDYQLQIWFFVFRRFTTEVYGD